MEAFQELQQHYQDRYSEARKWKADGGKVVGYLSSEVPEEIVTAAELFPLRIAGDARRKTSLADQYMESSFDPVVRSVYDMALAGELEFLDLLVIPRVNDSVFKLYYYMKENQRTGQWPKIPELYLFDMLHTRWWSSSDYNLDRLRVFKQKMASVSGIKIRDKKLSAAISAANENRRMLQEISRLRWEKPPRLSGADAFLIQAASTCMKKEDHNRLLKAFLEDPPQETPASGARIMFKGNPLDSLELYRKIEESGVTIVAENHDWGYRCSEFPVSEETEPMQALLDRYHLRALTPKNAAFPEENEGYIQKAIDLGVDGVFFFSQSHDLAAWEYPRQKQLLEAEGIPTASMAYDENIFDATDRISETVRKLVSH